jgi:Zn-dependent protease
VGARDNCYTVRDFAWQESCPGVRVFNYNQSPFSQNRYGSETLAVNDPRRSRNPWRAIAAHVRWEIVLGFLIMLGFFVFVLALDQDKWRIPGTIGLVVTGWVFSLCLHEFAHAATAYLGGDHSDGTSSYLSFNPLKYLNPLLSIVLPLVFILLGGIALPGGAVYVRRDLVRNRAWQSAISLAGPLMNAVCLGLIALAFQFPVVTGHFYLAAALALLAFFQAFAVILNLIPIPPLDGFGVIAPYLPPDLRQSAYSFGTIGFIVIFLLLYQVPGVSDFFFNTIFNLLAKFNIDHDNVVSGFQSFQFWQYRQ